MQGDEELDTGLWRALLDAAPDAIIAVDSTGRIVLVNAQSESLFGYGREDLIGEPLELLVPEVARGVHTRHRRRYFSNPVARPMGAGMELAGRRKDGTEFPAEISLSSIRTSDGVIVSAAVRDATDRKRAEAKFRDLLEAAPDAIVGVDTRGRIALVNTRAESLFGYARGELLGEPLEILVPDDAKHIHPTWRAAYFRDPHPRPMGVGMELAARRKDGTEFPAEISLSAIDTEEGRIVSAAVRDVTDRKRADAERERLKAQAERERLEARMHQSQRLESLGQLAGGVAHDFNNLLTVILNYTAIIGEQVGRAAEEPGGQRWQAVHGDLEQVHGAAERAAELTRQLLAFGRREVVDPQPLDLTAVVQSVERLLRRTIGEHIDLAISSEPDLQLVMADRGQVEQVLLNLAVNARDAMAAGGRLTISTCNVEVSDAERRPGLAPGRYVALAVSDTGVGMTREVAERVFEPFFTTKPKGAGSGLGLATVHGIVRQAGGDVEIDSEPGAGTTVRTLLPVTDARPSDERLPSIPPPQPRGETVLVVDDQEPLRELTRRLLVRNGYTVLTASSGREALDLVRAHAGDIHLLLTDVAMPHMLGPEVADRVHELRPGLPVLFMSGYAQPVVGVHGSPDEGVTLLQKPFTEATLLIKVRTLLDAPPQR